MTNHEPIVGQPNSRAAGYYAHVGVDVLWTGDLAETEDMQLPPVRPDDETGSFDVQEMQAHRRGFERYDLTQNFVRASVIDTPGSAGHVGRVTNASVTGMWVETSHPLPFRTDVDVDWCVTGTFSMRFHGRVVRATDSGMAVVLEVDDESWRFRSSFIDLARTRSEAPPSVIVAPHRGAPFEQPDDKLENLGEVWKTVEEALHDDAAHQVFINACLSARRLEYALERYRELKLHNPESEVATRYLKQIGTILTFYTLKKKGEREPTPRWKKALVVLAIISVGATAALTFAERMAQSRLHVRSAAIHMTPPPGAIR